MKKLFNKISSPTKSSPPTPILPGKHFGVSLETLVRSETDKIKAYVETVDLRLISDSDESVNEDSDQVLLPSVLKALIKYLTSRRVLETEGVLRLSGSAKVVKDLIQYIENDGGMSVTALESKFGHDIFAVAGVLKAWIRSVPGSIIPARYYKDFLAAAPQVFDQNATVDGKALKSIGAAISRLPDENYYTLRYILTYALLVGKNAEKNKMSCSNLSLILAPNLFGSPAVDAGLAADATSVNDGMTLSALVNTMLVNFDKLFLTEEESTHQELEVVLHEDPVPDSAIAVTPLSESRRSSGIKSFMTAAIASARFGKSSTPKPVDEALSATLASPTIPAASPALGLSVQPVDTKLPIPTENDVSPLIVAQDTPSAPSSPVYGSFGSHGGGFHASMIDELRNTLENSELDPYNIKSDNTSPLVSPTEIKRVVKKRSSIFSSTSATSSNVANDDLVETNFDEPAISTSVTRDRVKPARASVRVPLVVTTTNSEVVRNNEIFSPPMSPTPVVAKSVKESLESVVSPRSIIKGFSGSLASPSPTKSVRFPEQVVSDVSHAAPRYESSSEDEHTDDSESEDSISVAEEVIENAESEDDEEQSDQIQRPIPVYPTSAAAIAEGFESDDSDYEAEVVQPVELTPIIIDDVESSEELEQVRPVSPVKNIVVRVDTGAAIAAHSRSSTPIPQFDTGSGDSLDGTPKSAILQQRIERLQHIREAATSPVESKHDSQRTDVYSTPEFKEFTPAAVPEKKEVVDIAPLRPARAVPAGRLRSSDPPVIPTLADLQEPETVKLQAVVLPYLGKTRESTLLRKRGKVPILRVLPENEEPEEVVSGIAKDIKYETLTHAKRKSMKSSLKSPASETYDKSSLMSAESSLNVFESMDTDFLPQEFLAFDNAALANLYSTKENDIKSLVHETYSGLKDYQNYLRFVKTCIYSDDPDVESKKLYLKQERKRFAKHSENFAQLKDFVRGTSTDDRSIRSKPSRKSTIVETPSVPISRRSSTSTVDDQTVSILEILRQEKVNLRILLQRYDELVLRDHVAKQLTIKKQKSRARLLKLSAELYQIRRSLPALKI